MSPTGKSPTPKNLQLIKNYLEKHSVDNPRSTNTIAGSALLGCKRMLIAPVLLEAKTQPHVDEM